MKKNVLPLLLVAFSPAAFADIFYMFRFEDGRTNWQYVANTSGTLLIIALTIVVSRLYLTRRQVKKYNRELEDIRADLEERVKERTATLDQANQQLQKSNEALEGEITQHLATTKRLARSESYITDILRSMPLMLVGLDKENNITQWNHRAEEISGIKAADAIGHNLWQTYPTITVQQGQVAQARNNNRTVALKHCQRGQYHFDITIYPLGDQSETGVVILIDDVTQQILAENMLIQRDKMSSMGEMAATMAHDINNPLRTILDDLAQVRDRLDNSQAATEIELLRDATLRAQQVASVVNNLLEFSNARDGDLRPADICTVLDHSIELAGDVLSSPSGLHFRDISIQRQYADDLPQVPCYAAELQQVFLSLFRHACHALGKVEKPDFTPQIAVEVSEAYDNLWIKIQHNGIGLNSQEQQLIFEPFFNSDPVFSDKGAEKPADEQPDASNRLSFSHFIIAEQHRGEMAVTSSPDAGSTFHIQLRVQ